MSTSAANTKNSTICVKASSSSIKQSKINSLQEQLADFPEGKLVCVHNGKYIKCFKSDGHTLNYISQKEHLLIEQLATKKYLSLLLEDLLHEQNAINFYLRHHNSKVSKAEQLLNDIPDYKDFLSSYFMPTNQELFSWTNSPYNQNNKYPEQLIYVHQVCTGSGLKMYETPATFTKTEFLESIKEKQKSIKKR